MSSQSSHSVSSSKNSEKLEVTVIPVDDFPYSKIIQIPHSMLGKPSIIALNQIQATLNTLLPVNPIRTDFQPQPPFLVQRSLQRMVPQLLRPLIPVSRTCFKKKSRCGSPSSATLLNPTSSLFLAFLGRKLNAKLTFRQLPVRS